MNTAQMVIEADKKNETYRLSEKDLFYVPGKGFIFSNGDPYEMTLAIMKLLHLDGWVPYSVRRITRKELIEKLGYDIEIID